jgi:hypothetical protein
VRRRPHGGAALIAAVAVGLAAAPAHAFEAPATVEGRAAQTPPPPEPPQTTPRPTATIRLGSLRRGRPWLRLNVDGGEGNRVRRVRLDFPRGMRLDRRTRLRGARSRSKGRAVEVPALGGGTRTVNLTLRAGTIDIVRRLRRAQRLPFTVLIIEASGRRTTRRLTVRPRP